MSGKFKLVHGYGGKGDQGNVLLITVGCKKNPGFPSTAPPPRTTCPPAFFASTDSSVSP
jgi:hypothetical protein